MPGWRRAAVVVAIAVFFAVLHVVGTTGSGGSASSKSISTVDPNGGPTAQYGVSMNPDG
jgi:hypothetical protein